MRAMKRTMRAALRPRISIPTRSLRARCGLLLASLALVATGGCGASRGGESARLPERVLVLPFADRTGSDNPLLADEITDLFVAELRIVHLSTQGPAEAREQYGDLTGLDPYRLAPATLSELAAATGCEGVLTGVITKYRSGGTFGTDEFAFNVRVTDARSGRTVMSTAFSSDTINRDAQIRGLDQLTLHGVTKVVHRLTEGR